MDGENVRSLDGEEWIELRKKKVGADGKVYEEALQQTKEKATGAAEGTGGQKEGEGGEEEVQGQEVDGESIAAR